MIFDILTGGYTFVEILIVLAAFALSIIVAISAHESAHAFAALKAGDPSAKLAGRLTLNPVKHFEPMGLLCFVFAGIGWAKPVPVNPFNYRNFKKGNFWVSIAGILTNLSLAFIFSFGFFVVDKFGNWNNLFIFGLGNFFMYCMVLNISLAVFNLLPIFPLDGYNLLVSFTKPNNSFMRFMRERGMIVLLVVLFVIPLIFGVSIIQLVGSVVINGIMSFWGLFF